MLVETFEMLSSRKIHRSILTEVYHFSDNDAADTETIITSGEFISMTDMLTVASELTDLNLNFKSFPSLPVFAPVRLSAVHDQKKFRSFFGSSLGSAFAR